MDPEFVHSQIADDLLVATGLNFKLVDVRDINSMFDERTIVMILYRLLFALRYSICWEKLIPSKFVAMRDSKTLNDTLLKNIRMLLLHPEIDYSMRSNLEVLGLAMTSTSCVSLKNHDIDEILGQRRLNPDVIMEKNSIAELLNVYSQTDIERVKIFLKHGADVDSRPKPNMWYNMPYYIAAKQHQSVLDTIVTHTKYFHHSGMIFGDNVALGISSETIVTLFHSILRCGKLAALENLNKNVINFDKWLRNIRGCAGLDVRVLRQCVGIPMSCFSLIVGNQDADDILRKLILFKHNLECMTQSTITVPAYKYYDVAIIILFLMRNRHLTVLTCDVLRHIATFVFS